MRRLWESTLLDNSIVAAFSFVIGFSIGKALSVPSDKAAWVGFALTGIGGLWVWLTNSAERAERYQLLSRIYAADSKASPREMRELVLSFLDLERSRGERPDLSKADFSRADFHRMDLSSVDLHETKLPGADLREANLTAANLRKAKLYGALIGEADLREADLLQANLGAVSLEQADLRWADLRGAYLQRACLLGADFRGADLREADIREATCLTLEQLAYALGDATTTKLPDDLDIPETLADVSLGKEGSGQKTRLWGNFPYIMVAVISLLIGLSIGKASSALDDKAAWVAIALAVIGGQLAAVLWIRKRAEKVNSRRGELLSTIYATESKPNSRAMREAVVAFVEIERGQSVTPNLSKADLSGVDLRGADLRGINLFETDLSGADLREAVLSETDLRGAKLTSVALCGANLCGADLRGASASGVTFKEADLSLADLRGTHLSRSDLSDADLSGADLAGAGTYLLGADLRGANLLGADLTGADLSSWKAHVCIPTDLSSAKNLTLDNLSGTRADEFTKHPDYLPRPTWWPPLTDDPDPDADAKLTMADENSGGMMPPDDGNGPPEETDGEDPGP